MSDNLTTIAVTMNDHHFSLDRTGDECRQREMGETQAVASAAPRVDRLGLEQSADVVERESQFRWGRPSTVARSAVGGSRPTIIRMVVDFPAPLGPRKPVTSPGRSSKLRRSTATVDP